MEGRGTDAGLGDDALVTDLEDEDATRDHWDDVNAEQSTSIAGGDDGTP
jgi:hypothetical protein